MYHMHTLGASKCMHVVHSVGFRWVLVLGGSTLDHSRVLTVQRKLTYIAHLYYGFLMQSHPSLHHHSSHVIMLICYPGDDSITAS